MKKLKIVFSATAVSILSLALLITIGFTTVTYAEPDYTAATLRQ